MSEEHLAAVLRQLHSMEEKLDGVQQILLSQRIEKEWYTSSQLADAMNVSRYTVQERWCNQGRIDCEKDTDTGKWRIPGAEYRRIVDGGKLRPKT